MDSFSPVALSGIFAAIPFAIWFFLTIEGAAMAAEEAKDPKRTIPRAFVGGILTLSLLVIAVICLVVMVYYNTLLALIFTAMMLLGYSWFRATRSAGESVVFDPQLAASK